MTTYVLTDGATTVLAYPYTIDDLRAANPSWSIPWPMTNEQMAEFDMFPVVTAPEPTYDANNQICETNSIPTLVEGVWVLEWTITNMTPEQKAEHDQEVQAQNKATASSLLTATDWASIPSVADPAQSNPYLVNQNEFFAYRSQVRAIAVNPPSTPVTNWPVLPPEVWA